MKKFLLFFISAIMAMVSVNAEQTYVWTNATAGNLVSTNEAFTATYVAQTTDVLNISAPETFASVECNGVQYADKYKTIYGTETGTYKYSFNVEAGQTVTFKSFSMWMNPGTKVYITEGKLILKETNVSPVANQSTFSWSTQGMVTVNFNKFVTATKAYIQCITLGNKQIDVVDELQLGGSSSLSCNITNALNEAYDAGLKPGDKFMLKFTGVQDEDKEKYGSNGTLTLTFIAPQQQGKLVSATVGDSKPLDGYKFLSWFPTDGTEGLFTFEFDKEVGEMTGESCVELQIGNPDLMLSGRFYRETLPCQVDGKKIIVDARGKLRSLTRMFPSVDFSALEEEGEGYFEFNTSYMGMQLKNITDKNGNPMYSTNPGSVGSYSYTFDYEEIKDDIAYDGLREEDYEGEIKKSGDNVQIYVDPALKSIDNITAYIQVDNGLGKDPETEEQLYTTGTINISKENIQILEQEEDYTIFEFKLPELKASVLDETESEPQMKDFEAAVGTNIRIVMQVTTKSGMPHDLVINYIYKEKITNSIENVNDNLNPNLNGAIYNILGQRVKADAKGLVIINGKKVVK